jgi:hypothetical protein
LAMIPEVSILDRSLDRISQYYKDRYWIDTGSILSEL